MSNGWGHPLTSAMQTIVQMKMQKERLALQRQQFEVEKAITGINMVRAIGVKFHELKPDQLEKLFGPLQRATGMELLPRDEQGQIIPPKPSFDEQIDEWLTENVGPMFGQPPTGVGAPPMGLAAPPTAPAPFPAMPPTAPAPGPTPPTTAPPTAPTGVGVPPLAPIQAAPTTQLHPNRIMDAVIRKRLGLPAQLDEMKWQWEQMWHGLEYEQKERKQTELERYRGELTKQREESLNIRRQALAGGEALREATMAATQGNREAQLALSKWRTELTARAKAKLAAGTSAQHSYELFIANPRIQTDAEAAKLNAQLKPYNLQMVKLKTTLFGLGMPGTSKYEVRPLDPNKPIKPFIEVPPELEELATTPTLPPELMNIFGGQAGFDAIMGTLPLPGGGP